MEKIRNGIAENIGHFIQLLGDIIISLIISFAYGWKLTLSICIYIPITIVINIIVSKVGIFENRIKILEIFNVIFKFLVSKQIYNKRTKFLCASQFCG